MKKHFEVTALCQGSPEQIIEQLEEYIQVFRGGTYTELNEWIPGNLIIKPIEPPDDTNTTTNRIITAQDTTHPNHPHVR